MVGRKFTIFALFYFGFEGNFQVQAPGGAYIWRGDLREGFLHYKFGGLYVEGLILGILRYACFILVECLISTNGFTSMDIIFLKKCHVVLLGHCRACIESTFFYHFKCMSLIKL